jgi:hypothetical protein
MMTGEGKSGESTNSNNLGTGVMRTSATRLKQLTVLPGGHTEVGDLDVLLTVEQQVLWPEKRKESEQVINNISVPGRGKARQKESPEGGG